MRETTTHELVTIPISHFCEKARWALDRAGIPYVERAHLQVIHRAVAWHVGRSLTVPVLRSPEGVFTDSTDILEYANRAGEAPGWLYPDDVAEEVRAIEHEFDEGLGPEGRRWMYFSMSDEKQLVLDYGGSKVPNWQRRALPVVWVAAKPIINRVLDINAETAATSLVRVLQTFDQIDERLADGREFLVGDSFTAADLTFAALSAAVLVPENYGVPLPQPDVLPEPMASQVRELRARPAGQFALRMYAQERTASAVPVA